MTVLSNHPTFRRAQESLPKEAPNPFLDSKAIESACLHLGADDAACVDLDRPELADQREDIVALLPRARTLISFVVRTNPEAIRAPARSIGNVEFHHTGDRVNEVGRRIAAHLTEQGIRAVNATMGFPMESDRWPGKMWVVAHKPVAIAAGLGRMGIHRNVIHPRFGSFILLGTVVTEARVDAPVRALDFNPCLECKLCVAACPTGAISPDGRFNFSACYTHNYREFMGGFGDWVEKLADSRNRLEYREKVSAPETASMWQSLGFGPNYKAAYCVAVCPAGEDVIGPFVTDRAAFLNEVVKPLQNKVETVYVTSGSDAEAHVARRFPHKKTKVVGNGLRPDSIRGFLIGLPLTFQPGVAKDLDATYHFTFTGEESVKATVRISRGALTVTDGHLGAPHLRVTADSRTWLRFLARETHLVWALLRGRVRLRGALGLLPAFGKCFPS